jgi:hypothetical protein
MEWFNASPSLQWTICPFRSWLSPQRDRAVSGPDHNERSHGTPERWIRQLSTWQEMNTGNTFCCWRRNSGFRRARVAIRPPEIHSSAQPNRRCGSITAGKIFRAVRKGGKVWGEDVTTGAMLQIVQCYARDGSRKAGALMTCAAPAPSSAASGSVISSIKNSCWVTRRFRHGSVFRSGAVIHLCRE